MAVDLHTHTTHSDGTLSPKELITLAAGEGLKALAVTDHDVTTANAEALKVGEALGIAVVPGIELSVHHPLPDKGYLDIIGLFIDHQHEELNHSLIHLREQRVRRNETICEKLADLGIEIDVAEVLQEAGTGSMGRPHIAAVLLKNGIVTSIGEAFQKYLKRGAPAYVEKVKYATAEALRLIKIAGGISILAHPFSLGFNTYEALGEEILRLKSLGLEGVEVYYPNYSEDMCRWLKTFAEKNGLLASGGSDFHGDVKPDIKVGRGPGSLHVPDSVYQDLFTYHARQKL